ncbi:unnamed protein product, partial [marine sediment metagenome]
MKRCVLVLGIPRSGTSAVSGLLNILGVYFGDNLINPSEANPKGFYEHVNLNTMHVYILSAIGTSWRDLKIPKLPIDWPENDRLKKYSDNIRNIIKADLAQ